MMRLLRGPRAVFAFAIAFALALWAAPAPAAESYSYDTQSRLTDVTYPNGGSLHYTYDANGNILSIVTSIAAAVEEGQASLQFALGPTTPNPGSGPRHLMFSIPSNGHVTLRVFDVSGRLVATLLDRVLPAGRHDAQFSTGSWAAGVYYYRLDLGARSRAGKLVVMR
jgi:YD repeat-containing protein